MTLSDLSIKNPVFAWMLMIGLIVFGGIGYSQMGKSMLPDVDFPIVSVNVTWEGASPEVVESEVTDPIEDAVMQVQGVKEVTSSSRQGNATITIEFDLNRDIDAALQEVQTKITQAQKTLPKDIDPPVINKTNPEDNPVMWVSLSSDRPLKEMMNYAKDELKDKFTTIPGVGEVVFGGYIEPNLRVWMDANKMQDRDLTVEDVMNAIRSEHAEMPAGYIDTGEKEMNVRVMGEAGNVPEFEKIVIPQRAGSPLWRRIHIGDVASVEDGLDDIRRISRVSGRPALGLGIKKQRGANAVDVANLVKKKLVDLQPTLPEGMKLAVNFDGTKFINDSIHELNFTLILSALLTAVVCWIFLGSLSSAININLAIPTSIIGTFLFLHFCGFTLNTFTLLGLTLVIGIVVDDAIMVLENIARHREMGEAKVHAALVGAREITFAAMAASIAILAIFVPVVFMPGIIGKFFFQFGVTISVAVLLSLLEALTLAPMRCSQFLEVGHTSFVGRNVDRFMNMLSKKYKLSLEWLLIHQGKNFSPTGTVKVGYSLVSAGLIVLVLLATVSSLPLLIAMMVVGGKPPPSVMIASGIILIILAAGEIIAVFTFHANAAHRPASDKSSAADSHPLLLKVGGWTHGLYSVMADRRVLLLKGSIIFFVASLSLVKFLKKEFVPAQDQSNMFIRIQTPVGSSIGFTDDVFKKAEEIVGAQGEVQRYYAAIGGFGGGEVNTGIMFITLKDPENRPLQPGRKKPYTQQELMGVMRDKLNAIPGVMRAIVQDLSLSGFSASRGFPIEFTLLGRDWEKMGNLSDVIMTKMKESGFMVDVDTDYQLGAPEVRVVPDREKAAARGVSIQTIGNTINAMIGGVRVGKYTRGGRRYDIRVRLNGVDRSNPKDINKIRIANNRGETMSLADVVKLEERKTLLTISRKNRERAITIFANVAPGKSQGEALAVVQKITKETLPEDVKVKLSGSAETFGESFKVLLFVLFLGILVAYMVLASQFNSFIHPVIVLMALPFSVTGAFIALGIGHQSINLYSMIGIILLMGIVKKNSILLVDFTNEQRKSGANIHDALIQACPIRLRPILMTTVSTIAAAIPPALALGPGAETRIPMALVIIGGVTVSTFLTLFAVPCAYGLSTSFESHKHDKELKEALKELGESHS